MGGSLGNSVTGYNSERRTAKRFCTRSSSDVWERCSSLRVHFNRHLGETPDLCRGVTPDVLLRGFGQQIRAGPAFVPDASCASPEDAIHAVYMQSQPVDENARFLSHSWHGSAFKKVMALFAFYNGQAATVLGLVLATTCGVLRSHGLLPAWNADAANYFATWGMGGPSRVAFCAWCTVGYSVGYPLGLFFWQPLRYRLARFLCLAPWLSQRDTVFLDKLCIHQGDRQLKQRAIESIGAFLERSRTLTILWEESYFTRLWCVFEMAVYVQMNQRGQLEFVHLGMGFTEIIMSLSVCLTILVIALLAAVGFLHESFHSVAQMGVPRLWISFIVFFPAILPATLSVFPSIRMYARAKKVLDAQLDGFAVANAKAHDERDREFVRTSIVNLYGSVIAFDTHIRTKFKDGIQQQAGDMFGVSYFLITRALSVPCVVYFAGDIPISFGGDVAAEYRRNWIVTFVPVYLLQSPLVIKLVCAFARANLETRSVSGEVVTVCITACVATFGISLWFVTFLVMLELPLGHKLAVDLACLLLPLALHFAARRRSRRLSAAAAGDVTARSLDEESSSTEESISGMEYDGASGQMYVSVETEEM